jgi:hypothetical protein
MPAFTFTENDREISTPVASLLQGVCVEREQNVALRNGNFAADIYFNDGGAGRTHVFRSQILAAIKV